MTNEYQKLERLYKELAITRPDRVNVINISDVDMTDKIYFTKICDPNKWDVLPLAFECKTPEDAKKAEKLFNRILEENTRYREALDKIASPDAYEGYSPDCFEDYANYVMRIAKEALEGGEK